VPRCIHLHAYICSMIQQKEEKAHDERIASANAKIKQAGESLQTHFDFD